MQESEVIVRLMGGLGNQLFQYAFGRRLAAANDANLVLDATGYGALLAEDDPLTARRCGLEAFNIRASILARQPPDKTPQGALVRRIRKLGEILLTLSERRKPYYMRREIVEPEQNHFHFDPRVCNRAFQGSVTIRGFWQSPKYFEAVADDLRDELTWREVPAADGRHLGDALNAASSVAIHIRHGDNARPDAHALGTLTREYYDKAIQQVREQLSLPIFLVFSDDVAWARQLLGHHKDLVFVERSKTGEDHMDMRHMSLCRHHIIANSTFSWWAAWIGASPGQIVCAPRRYYQGIDRPNPDLYPDGWKLI